MRRKKIYYGATEQERSDAMEKLLAILDGEEHYMSRLLAFFRGQERFREIQVAVFTNEESYYRYEQNHSIGLLLCEESMYREMKPKPACRTILLAGRGCVRETQELQVIFKFQPAQMIFDEIMACFDRLEAVCDSSKAEEESRLVVFCAAEGGMGVSRTAFATARYRAKKKNVLFLSLDPLDNPGETAETSTNLSEAIYLVKANSNQIQQRLPELVTKKEHVSCLYGVGHWSDLSECTAGEMKGLLDEICRNGGYDEVLADMGELTDAAAGCLERASKVIMLVRREAAPSVKEKEFVRQATFRDSDFAKRLIRVERKEGNEHWIAEMLYGEEEQ